MRLTPILALAALLGCSNVDPRAVLALSQLSPLTADPADIRAAVEIPPGIDIAAGGAMLTFAASRTDTGQSDEGVFVLDMVETPQGMKLFRLDPEDRPDYLRLRDKFSAWETEAPDDTNGTFSIQLAACKTGQGPQPDARFSVFVATAQDAPLAVLIRAAPIADALERAQVMGASEFCN